MYITREIEGKIRALFASEQSKGLILAGIVGCGKNSQDVDATTLLLMAFGARMIS